MAIVHVICLVVYYYMIRIHSQSRAKRSKDEVEGIKVALQDIAGALREGNAALRERIAIYKKVQQKLPLPIPEAEIWRLLEDLKIERQVFTRAYLYLLDNPERIKAVIGCPLDKRKELLLEMVFGHVGPSRHDYFGYGQS